MLCLGGIAILDGTGSKGSGPLEDRTEKKGGGERWTGGWSKGLENLVWVGVVVGVANSKAVCHQPL